ncbi:MAG TPA: SIS domain-containing protein [Aliidiomarina sp.]|nr:SIS domain-containing protein [Aliidiomarina sp.]
MSYFSALERHKAVFSTVKHLADEAQELFSAVLKSLKSGGKIVWLGNGGSAADSQHLAAELMVRYKGERAPLASIALTTDTSILTAHPNDYSFDTVFSRQVEGLVQPNDVVIGLTTSGQSTNVNLALAAANSIGAYSVALTGRDGGQVKDIAKLSIIVNSDETARIQEVHMFLGHWLCEALDKEFSQ